MLPPRHVWIWACKTLADCNSMRPSNLSEPAKWIWEIYCVRLWLNVAWCDFFWVALGNFFSPINAQFRSLILMPRCFVSGGGRDLSNFALVFFTFKTRAQCKHVNSSWRDFHFYVFFVHGLWGRRKWCEEQCAENELFGLWFTFILWIESSLVAPFALFPYSPSSPPEVDFPNQCILQYASCRSSQAFILDSITWPCTKHCIHIICDTCTRLM